VTLHWPLSLAVSPVDNTLHILDNNVVLRVTSDNKVVVVAGRLLHCPLRHADAGLLGSDADCASGCPAVDVVLQSPQHVAFAPDGQLYVVESGAAVARVRAVDTDGLIRAYVGGGCDERSAAACVDERLATRVKLATPTAVTITPDDVVHVADMGRLRVHSVVPPVPAADRRTGRYEVLDASSGQTYTFNRYGQHVSTVDLMTGRVIYNFTYSVNSYYGRLMKVFVSLSSDSFSRNHKPRFAVLSFLGRLFDTVDLITPVSNVRPSVRTCVLTSVHKKFLRFQ